MGVANDGGPRQGAWFGIEAEPEREGTADGPFAGVVFNRPIDQVFSYRVPARIREKVRLGTRLRVPLGRGNQPAVGYCVRLDDAFRKASSAVRVKDVLDVLDDPPLIDAAMLELTRWLAGYYACSWGQALDAAVPAGVKKHAGTRVGTFLTVPEEVRQTYDHARRCPPSRPRRWRSSAARPSRSRSPTSAGWPTAPAGRSRPCGGAASSTRSGADSGRGW